jgi:hypothetical protein
LFRFHIVFPPFAFFFQRPQYQGEGADQATSVHGTIAAKIEGDLCLVAQSVAVEQHTADVR